MREPINPALRHLSETATGSRKTVLRPQVQPRPMCPGTAATILPVPANRSTAYGLLHTLAGRACEIPKQIKE